jgi:uncharacterized membrane protein
VVLTDSVVGLVLLITLALLGKESVPEPLDLLWGGLAGVAGVLGLLSFYSALSRAKMGVAAPVSAALTVALSVLRSRVHGRTPDTATTGGFVLAGLSIGLISRPQREGSLQGIGLAGLSGCGFGCFFILISWVNPATTFWPLVVARFTSIGVLLVL